MIGCAFGVDIVMMRKSGSIAGCFAFSLLIATLTAIVAFCFSLGQADAVGQEPNWFNGDANCDGGIDSIDAAVVLQYDAGIVDSLAGDGDANEDGAVNSLDASLILQFDAGLIEDRPANACVIPHASDVILSGRSQ
jgi:hypothetical protein